MLRIKSVCASRDTTDTAKVSSTESVVRQDGDLLNGFVQIHRDYTCPEIE